MECCRAKIWSLLLPKINCSIYGSECLIPLSYEIPECQSYQSASQTYFQTRQYFNKNTVVDMESKTTPEVANVTTALTLAYSSLLIEERVETFVHDIESVMTSIGGNLVIL